MNELDHLVHLHECASASLKMMHPEDERYNQVREARENIFGLGVLRRGGFESSEVEVERDRIKLLLAN